MAENMRATQDSKTPEWDLAAHIPQGPSEVCKQSRKRRWSKSTPEIQVTFHEGERVCSKSSCKSNLKSPSLPPTPYSSPVKVFSSITHWRQDRHFKNDLMEAFLKSVPQSESQAGYDLSAKRLSLPAATIYAMPMPRSKSSSLVLLNDIQSLRHPGSSTSSSECLSPLYNFANIEVSLDEISLDGSWVSLLSDNSKNSILANRDSDPSYDSYFSDNQKSSDDEFPIRKRIQELRTRPECKKKSDASDEVVDIALAGLKNIAKKQKTSDTTSFLV